MRSPDFTRRLVLAGVALTGLFLVYILQRLDYLGLMSGVLGMTPPTATVSFIVNRTLRLIANDLLCLLLISVLFQEPRFSRVAFWIFLVELFVILPLYLFVKLTIEGPSEISSPLLQPIHRMIVNPLLMVILIAAFYYQRWLERPKAHE